jgi:hypothetical protein
MRLLPQIHQKQASNKFFLSVCKYSNSPRHCRLWWSKKSEPKLSCLGPFKRTACKWWKFKKCSFKRARWSSFCLTGVRQQHVFYLSGYEWSFRELRQTMIYTVANLPKDNRAHALLGILSTHLLLAGMCNHRGHRLENRPWWASCPVSLAGGVHW